jgi:predicted ATPase
VGRNASGKSNFVDALAFLADALTTSVAEAARLHGGTESLLNRQAKVPVCEIGIETDFPSYQMDCRAEYSVSFKVKARRTIEVEFESLRIRDLATNQSCGFDVRHGVTSWVGLEHFGHGGFERVPRNEEPPVRHDPRFYPRMFDEFKPDRLLLAVIGSQPFIDLAERLRSSAFYNFNPAAMRPPCRADASPQLERDGNNLAHAIEAQNELVPERVHRMAAYLAVITGEVERFNIQRIGEFETIRFRMRRTGNNKPTMFGSVSMSDGTLRAIASLVAAFQAKLPTDPGIVAIEEPETALHPAAMRALVDALDEATEFNQILLTTHSADLLEGRDITPGQCLVVRNRNGQSLIAPVSRASHEIVRKELYTLGDLQRMDRLDLDEADLKRQARLRNGSRGT